MATGNFILDKGYDLAAGQVVTKFFAVKFSGNAEEVTPVTGNADLIAGFSQFGVTAAELLDGKGVSARLLGITEAVAVGAIAVGALVTLEADGRVSNYVGASGKRVVGRCVGSPAANANDRISLLVNLHGGVA